MSSLFIATPAFTSNCTMIFGKNTDREPNEGQSILRVLAMEQPDKEVQCTYRVVPQVKRTFEVILAKPFHAWGAEAGINEHGVAIGNATVFGKLKSDGRNLGLTGHDMVRLALERTRTAELALETLCGLVSAFGQDAADGYTTPFTAQNSFIIADARQAFLLETAGKHWVAQKIETAQAITNAYTIGEHFDYHSKGVVEFAHAQGWVKKGKEFSFKEAYGLRKQAKKLHAETTCNYLLQQMETRRGTFEVAFAIDLLRSHHPSKKFNPSVAKKAAVCKHITTGQQQWQTNNSSIFELRQSGVHTAWLTGTSHPCLSLFKPFFIPGKNLYEGLVREPAKLINNSLWWQAEQFHRKVAQNYRAMHQHFAEEQVHLQEEWLGEEQRLILEKATNEELSEFSTQTFNKHLKRIMEWNFYLKKNPPSSKQFSPMYKRLLERLTQEVTPVT